MWILLSLEVLKPGASLISVFQRESFLCLHAFEPETSEHTGFQMQHSELTSFKGGTLEFASF